MYLVVSNCRDQSRVNTPFQQCHFSRVNSTRTSDHLVPNQAFYQLNYYPNITTTVQYQSSYTLSGFFLWESQNSLWLFPHLLKSYHFGGHLTGGLTYRQTHSRPGLSLQAYRGLALYEVHQGTSQIREPNIKFETLDSKRNNAGSR